MQFSIGISDLISAITGLIAFFALGLSVYSVRVANKVATADFQTSEKVKSDVAELVATLRSIMLKGVIYSQKRPDIRDDAGHPEYISNEKDLDKIEEFMRSTTALAFYSFVSERSKVAKEKDQCGEEWRTFFLQLVSLSTTKNQWLASKRAADLERMLDNLQEQEFSTLSNYLGDIPTALDTLFRNREHDVIIQALVGSPKEGRDHPDFFPEFIKYLRETKSIKDPNVELFWAARSGEVKVAEKAIADGAKVHITEGELLRKYSEFADEFDGVFDQFSK